MSFAMARTRRELGSKNEQWRFDTANRPPDETDLHILVGRSRCMGSGAHVSRNIRLGELGFLIKGVFVVPAGNELPIDTPGLSRRRDVSCSNIIGKRW